MHEVGIMEEVLAAAAREAARHGATRILRVRLRIGDLSGAVPEALLAAFEVLKQGTIAEPAVLDCERVPATARCKACGADFVATDVVNECPRCGAVSATLTGGRELELISVDLE
jgi:hydrogenase nickel incorporation protein HypA/HybF